MYEWKNKLHMFYACEGCDRLCVIVSLLLWCLRVHTANCIRLRRQLAPATGKKKENGTTVWGKKKKSMNSKCTMTKPAILCSCRLLNHHFVYLLSERNTSHFHPRNCLGDSSVECLCDGRLPPSWQQCSCHQYNAKSVTNTHKTRKMAPLSQAAAAAHSSLPVDRKTLPGGIEWGLHAGDFPRLYWSWRQRLTTKTFSSRSWCRSDRRPRACFMMRARRGCLSVSLCRPCDKQATRSGWGQLQCLQKAEEQHEQVENGHMDALCNEMDPASRHYEAQKK